MTLLIFHFCLYISCDLSRSFLTDSLRSYHHFLAVITVISSFLIFRFKSCHWFFVLRALHPPLGSLIGFPWWIAFVLLFSRLLYLLSPTFHCYAISSNHSFFESPHSLWLSIWLLVLRSFLTDILWSYNLQMSGLLVL